MSNTLLFYQLKLQVDKRILFRLLFICLSIFFLHRQLPICATNLQEKSKPFRDETLMLVKLGITLLHDFAFGFGNVGQPAIALFYSFLVDYNIPPTE